MEEARLAMLESIALKYGSHGKPAGDAIEACAMEFVSYLANERWSNRPQCACPVLTTFVIALNDNWSDADRQRLKPFLPRLIGTRSTPEIEIKRGIASLDWTMRVHRPIWIAAAGYSEFAAKLRALTEIVDEASFKPAMAIQDKVIQQAARGARAARAARYVMVEWDARYMMVEWDAWAAWAAGGRRDARAAWGATAAWTTWTAWIAAAARTLPTIIAFNVGSSLSKDAADEQHKEAGIAALESVAREVRDAELVLLDRMIGIVS